MSNLEELKEKIRKSRLGELIPSEEFVEGLSSFIFCHTRDSDSLSCTVSFLIDRIVEKIATILMDSDFDPAEAYAQARVMIQKAEFSEVMAKHMISSGKIKKDKTHRFYKLLFKMLWPRLKDAPPSEVIRRMAQLLVDIGMETGSESDVAAEIEKSLETSLPQSEE
jgi:hypothetical protein